MRLPPHINGRTVGGLLIQIFNPCFFGAKGDGITDDAAAIQEAIDAASAAGGGKVYLPVGTYSFATTLTVPGNIILEGAGNGSILSYTGSSYALRSDNVADETVAIENLIIRNLGITGTASADHALYFVGLKHSRFDNLVITNFSQVGKYAIYISGNAGAGYVGAFYNIFYGVIISGCDNGIMLTGTHANGQANENIIFGGKISTFEGYGVNCDQANHTTIMCLDIEGIGPVGHAATCIEINDIKCVVFSCRLEHDGVNAGIGIKIESGVTSSQIIANNLTGFQSGQYLIDSSGVTNNLILQSTGVTGNVSLGNGNLSLQPLTDTADFVQFKDSSGDPILHLNAVNHRVGLGTSVPYAALHIGDSGSVSFSTATYTGTPTVLNGSLVDGAEIGYGIYSNESVKNRRVKFFLDDTGGVYGIWGTQTTSVPSFVIGNTTTLQFSIDSNHNVAVGNAALATDATNGFLYIPTCAGTPTGTPTTKTGLVPMVYDSTNHKLYIYDGSWLDMT